MMHRPDIGEIPYSMRRMLRMREATDYSGLGRTSIYNAAKAGQIETAKIGKSRLVVRASLDKFLTPTTP